jgi:hypothetical protein
VLYLFILSTGKERQRSLLLAKRKMVAYEDEYEIIGANSYLLVLTSTNIKSSCSIRGIFSTFQVRAGGKTSCHSPIKKQNK